MRKWGVAVSTGIALGAAAVPTSASATFMEIKLLADATGLTYPLCKPGDPPSACAPIPTTQRIETPYFYADLNFGPNLVEYGKYNLNGFFSGTVTWVGANLTGTNLTYQFQPCSGPNCAYTNLSAPTFTIMAKSGVPEPATWAMMILGFGVAGMALRRRERRTFAVA